MAPVLKKEFKRLNIPLQNIEEYAAITGVPSDAIVRAFLEFAGAPPAADARELMAQGLKGPEIGQAQAAAEVEAYSSLIGELRVFIRGLLLVEQEVKFSGILKIMPSPAVIAIIESLLPKLPSEAVRLPADKFHVTLAHQSVLRPYTNELRHMVKGPMLPPPPVIIDPKIVERVDELTGRKSWVVWVRNQVAVGDYLNEIMSMVKGPKNIWKEEVPPRKFHISIANLTGNPGDSVR